MKTTQLAAQIYTIRNKATTASELAAALKKIQRIGYPAVEVGGLSYADDQTLAKIIADAGLVCCSRHGDSLEVWEDPEAFADKLDILGVQYGCCSGPWPHLLSTKEAVTLWAERYNKIGAVLRSRRKSFQYHNHALEFVKIDGVPALEMLYELTDPENVKAILDTFWVQRGGGNPVDWCRKLHGRLPLLHLKDYGYTIDDTHRFAEIGAGSIDFKAVIPAAIEAGCKWFIVEQDVTPGDPLDSLKMSYDYICENLVD